MNKITNLSSQLPRHRREEVLRERFARRVAAALSEGQRVQPRPDIDERLRVAREQALARLPRTQAVRQTASAPVVSVGAGGAAVLGAPGGTGTPWWLRLSALLPLALLVLGLFLIDRHYTQAQIEAAAEVDAAILADDLPPEAYRDPGFVEFLKRERR